MSHELFRRKFNVRPYYSVEHRGWKFGHLNNFLGDTMTAGHADFKTGVGSPGEEQLNWFEAELSERKPTFVFVHIPLYIMKPTERKDYGIYSLLKQHCDTIPRVVSEPKTATHQLLNIDLVDRNTHDSGALQRLAVNQNPALKVF